MGGLTRWGEAVLTERTQVLCLEDLLQGRGVDDGQLAQDGAQHRVEEHVVTEEAELHDQFGLQVEGSHGLLQELPLSHGAGGTGQG